MQTQKSPSSLYMRKHTLQEIDELTKPDENDPSGVDGGFGVGSTFSSVMVGDLARDSASSLALLAAGDEKGEPASFSLAFLLRLYS